MGFVGYFNGISLSLLKPQQSKNDLKIKNHSGSPGLAASFLYLMNCGLPGVEANLFHAYRMASTPGYQSVIYVTHEMGFVGYISDIF